MTNALSGSEILLVLTPDTVQVLDTAAAAKTCAAALQFTTLQASRHMLHIDRLHEEMSELQLQVGCMGLEGCMLTVYGMAKPKQICTTTMLKGKDPNSKA